MGRPKTINKLDELESKEEISVSSDISSPIGGEEIKENKPEEQEKSWRDDGEYNLVVTEDYDHNRDMFKIPKPDSNYRYRFISTDVSVMALRLSNDLFHGGGWQIVPKSHNIKIGFSERELTPEGHKKAGLNILAFMPAEYYNKKMEVKRERNEAPMKSIKKMIQGGNPGDGLQTGEQMGFGSSSRGSVVRKVINE